MKKLIILFAIIFSATGFSQTPGLGGNRAGAGNVTGRFYGRVVDAANNKGVEAVSVQLLQNRFDSVSKTRKDVVVNGMLTDAKGNFSLENVQLFGQYKLKVTGIGFKELEQPVSFNFKPGGDMSAMMGALDKDLGNIKISVDEKILGNVTVSAAKPLVQLGIDRKIFNVDRNIVSAGGTAVDVMKNVPSLSVDIDGNVSLRNNAPQIFVDGRPTTLTLEQIPADAIESVEIITNPSAKFDASGGTAGILNIVLKKNKKVGYNGNVRANIDSRARVGLGGDINIRQNKINVFAGVNFNQRKSISRGTTERLTRLGNPYTQLSQNDKSIMEGSFGFGRAGFDYFIDNRNTITVSGTFAKGGFKPNTTSDLWIDSLYTIKTSSFNERTSNSENEFRNLGTNVSFKHIFPKAGQEWTADVTYNKSRNKNNNTIQTDFYNLRTSSVDSIFRQKQNGSGNNSNLIIQTDYVNPINDNSKFEMGARAAIRKVNSANNFFYFTNPMNSDAVIFIPSLSVKYNSTDNVYAAYATYSSRIKNFGYQLGLRAESSNYEGHLPDKNQDFSIDFPLSLFPSVFLSQKLKNDQELQLNYSRRINRPGFWQLFPFTDYSDSLNISRGNPNLNPEFTNSIELSYMKIFKNKDNFLASLYFKHTNDLITRYQVIEQNLLNAKDVLVNTYINANSSYITGLELTARNKITKWWDLNSNLNLFTSKIDIDDPTQQEQNQFASWFGKINNNFKLPKNFSMQLSADYQSKTVLSPGSGGRGGFGGGMFGSGSSSQGFVRANYGVDAAIRYEFLKNKTASVSLNVNDIFRTRLYDAHSESIYFAQDITRRRDPQVFRLNFNLRFGKFDMSLFKRKNEKGERESMQSGSEINF